MTEGIADKGHRDKEAAQQDDRRDQVEVAGDKGHHHHHRGQPQPRGTPRNIPSQGRGLHHPGLSAAAGTACRTVGVMAPLLVLTQGVAPRPAAVFTANSHLPWRLAAIPQFQLPDQPDDQARTAPPAAAYKPGGNW